MSLCANCFRSFKMNSVVFGGGQLKSGGEICSKCWAALIDMDYALGQKVKDMSLEDFVYKLSSFKKTVHHKLYETGLLSEENGRLIPGKGIGRAGQNSTAANSGEKQEDCVQCLKSLKGNKAFLGMGKLKTGQEICEDCWIVLSRLDGSINSRMQEFSPADVKLLFDVIENRYPPAETETLTEKTPEPVAEDLSQPKSELTKPITETKAPDVNAVTNRSEARLAAIGITRNSYPELWSVKELDELTTLLTEEEHILAALKGTYGKEPAALVATGERFILLSKKAFGGDVAEVYKLSWILSVESTVVGALSDVTFSLSSNTIKLMDADRERAAAFCDTIKPLLAS